MMNGWHGVTRLWTLECLSLAFCALLLLLLGAIEWRAEAWVALSILLFFPPVVYVLPFVVLTPVMLSRRKGKHVVLHIVCIAIVMLVFMRWRFHPQQPEGTGRITLITHNIGQGEREAFADYFPGEEPDIVLLQDAARRQAGFARRFPKHRVKALDQFLILSPHTILRGDLMDGLQWKGRSVAARFELMVNGREVAVYNVHMPTPRPSLMRIFSPRVWAEMLGVADAPTEGFPSYRAWLDARIALMRALATELEREKLPYLVGGDFNMPDHGQSYRLIAGKAIDAFAASGNGWGLTFPGAKDSTSGAVFGAWLRIDYLFAGRGWKPVDCRTANDARSQHRAVLARFEPSK